MPTKEITLLEMMDRFGSEDACHEALAELRWPEGVHCPACDSASVSYLKKRRQYDCNACRKRFSVRAGTIFNDSHLPLRKWFLAVYIMVQSKKSVSANQLKRMLGVSYKTAWYLCHRIRHAVCRDGEERKLSGVVEADETFLGGPGELGDGHYSTYMDTVIGAAERGGEVRLRAIPDRTAKHVHAFIKENVSSEADALHTDAYKGYIGAASKIRVPHGRVKKTRGEWVNGQVHTNTIEGVFSLLDRSIIGAYHKISKKHLPAYLNEVEWRYNNRDNPYLFRDTLLALIGADPVEYKELTA